MQQGGRNRPGRWGSGDGYGKGRGRGIANTRRWKRIIPGQRFEQGIGNGQASGIKGVPPRHDFSSPLPREKEISALEERLRALEEQKNKPISALRKSRKVEQNGRRLMLIWENVPDAGFVLISARWALLN